MLETNRSLRTKGRSSTGVVAMTRTKSRHDQHRLTNDPMQLAAVFFVLFCVCIVQHHRVIRMVVDLQTNGSEEREKRERGGVVWLQTSRKHQLTSWSVWRQM